MKAASATLIAMLAASRQFFMSDIYTFTLSDGTVLVYRSGDTVNGYKVSSTEPQAPIIQ